MATKRCYITGWLLCAGFLLWLVDTANSTNPPPGGYTKLLKLGLITPLEGELGFARVAAATTLAIDQAHADGYITDVDVRFIWRDGNCDGKAALGVTVDLKQLEDVDGYVGLACSEAAITAGKIIAYWDLPHLSYNSVDPLLADKVTYNTLVRLISPYNRHGQAIVEMFKYYNWRRVVMVMLPDPDNYCDIAGRAFEESFRSANITLADWIKPRIMPSEEQMKQILRDIKIRGRIVVICATDDYVRAFMLLAQIEEMTKGDYVYITPTLFALDDLEQPWIRTDGRDEEARQAYGPLLQMALGFSTNPEARAFMDEIPYLMTQHPWNYNGTLDSGQTGSPFALFLFDAVYLYAMVAHEAYQMGSTPNNGTLLFSLAKRKTFKGKTGSVRLDSNGDRIGDYNVWHLSHDAGAYEGLLEIEMTTTSDADSPTPQRVRILRHRNWGPSGTGPPLGSPKCGFFNELCPQDTTSRDMIIIAVTVLGVIVTGVVMGGIVIYRRKKFEQEFERMLWKMKFEEIDFISKAVETSKDQLGSDNGLRASSASLSGGRGRDNVYGSIRIGYLRGSLVALKMLKKSQILLTRQDHMELKVMRDISHENLNPFIGACVEAPNICIIYKFCSRGGLQDIIQNGDIKLDQNFKYSLIADLISGMDYLHKSPMKSHGRLKSRNCVVDGRWVLKITDWGLGSMQESHYENEQQKYKALFWTAPELLRDAGPPNGTQKGDVYSFAIILQELLYRAPPFEATGGMEMVPRDIIGRIRNGETPPYRPSLPTDHLPADKGIIQLMQECWQEDPVSRPDFVVIKTRFNNIGKGKRYNIMDNMLRMMEKYANNLEDLVSERTKQLTDEKKKTDMLLYRMLPNMVADCLKQGKTVTPQMFREVSVYFSDIVAFTEMASSSSPMEVVDFLNDLWTLFDDVIAKYDVYKVETIGDAYMVASGVPITNAGKHASEIANMALDILSSVMTFKIRHRPQEQLAVRIGIHCGSVVAGVVGQTMPRYCLFGDTVNTASRMESTGAAMKIHISKSAFRAMIATNEGYYMCERGQVEIKGKGLQTTYWLEGKEGYSRPLPKCPD